jgi:hypothetical protein
VLLGLASLVLEPQREQVAGHAYPIPSPGKRIRVEVLNGTRRPGFARTATRALRERGLDVVFFGTAPAADSTRIVVQPDTLRRVDVSVVLGNDWRPRLKWHP